MKRYIWLLMCFLLYFSQAEGKDTLTTRLTWERTIENRLKCSDTAYSKISSWSKKYVKANHLSNTRVVLSDRLVGGKADIVAAYDYYPFGFIRQRFETSGSESRHLYNGKEFDKETGTLDYGFRIYNPALGRFLSVDPIANVYGMLTPYQFASNRPIECIDLDGLEAVRPPLRPFRPSLPAGGRVRYIRVPVNPSARNTTFDLFRQNQRQKTVRDHVRDFVNQQEKESTQIDINRLNGNSFEKKVEEHLNATEEGPLIRQILLKHKSTGVLFRADFLLRSGENGFEYNEAKFSLLEPLTENNVEGRLSPGQRNAIRSINRGDRAFEVRSSQETINKKGGQDVFQTGDIINLNSYKYRVNAPSTSAPADATSTSGGTPRVTGGVQTIQMREPTIGPTPPPQ